MKLRVDQLREFIEPIVSACKSVKGFEKFNTEMLIEWWSASIPAGIGFAYGAVVDEKPVGFLLGVNMVSPLSGEKEASEYLWAVLPEHRGGGTALKLLREFEEGAEKDGCASTIIGLSIFYKPDLLRAKYLRLGYEPVIESFKKRI